MNIAIKIMNSFREFKVEMSSKNLLYEKLKNIVKITTIGIHIY